MQPLLRQFSAFFSVGVIAAVVHYGLLVGLVEGMGYEPVPATLIGYVAGGLVSYGLNERLTYQRRRSHAQAGWRFALVAAIGFGLTYGLMTVFVAFLAMNYVFAQLLTTGIILIWSFFAHKLFSFNDKQL